MKKVLLAATALCLSTGAYAADLPARYSRVAPAALLPVFTWTGFYVGAQVGVGFQHDKLTEYDICFPNCPDRATGKSTGVVGGGHAGYNWQAGSFVFGLEADLEGTSLRHKTVYPLSAPDTFSSEILWQASVRGRLGFAIDRLLIYGTGGVAFADIKHTYFEAVARASQSFSNIRTGWTAGGGVEYAFTDRWTARVEYRYSDFGKSTDFPAVVFPRFREEHVETEQAVRIGASYRF